MNHDGNIAPRRWGEDTLSPYILWLSALRHHVPCELVSDISEQLLTPVTVWQ